MKFGNNRTSFIKARDEAANKANKKASFDVSRTGNFYDGYQTGWNACAKWMLESEEMKRIRKAFKLVCLGAAELDGVCDCTSCEARRAFDKLKAEIGE